MFAGLSFTSFKLYSNYKQFILVTFTSLNTMLFKLWTKTALKKLSSLSESLTAMLVLVLIFYVVITRKLHGQNFIDMIFIDDLNLLLYQGGIR